MELRHLRYFVETARRLHFTKAARALGISQPPLTQQIQALEREIGVALFDRSARRVALTEAGRSFLADAEAILEHVKFATADAARVGQGRAGRLRVGFTESASFNPVVTGVLRRFRTAYPDIDLELRERQTTRLASDIVADELDLAFVRPPLLTGADLAIEILASERLLAALPSDHALAGRRQLRLVDLAAERFISYPRLSGRGLSDEILDAFLNKGYSPAVVQETPQLSSTVNLVAAGLGIAVVPESLRHMHAQAVCYLPIEDLALQAHLAIVQRHRGGSAAQANFVEMARAGAVA